MIIPYQSKVMDDVFFNFDYTLGTHEVLLSGSVGSAKSILMAHIAIRHCIENRGARLLLARKAMPDLKDTIFTKILEHLQGSFKEGFDYSVNHTTTSIRFRNGSSIISRSWSDKKYKKMRSLELSAAIFEELTENDDQDKQAYDEIKMRVGRLPHIKSKFIIAATNPDAPSHWAYKYFIISKKKTRHVYYSVTTDNPFLPKEYIDQLLEDLDPKMAERMIRGRWIEIATEVIYYSYDRNYNFRERDYIINKDFPIHIMWDFNIGEGKPMSCAVAQYINDEWHIFDEVVIEGVRTLQIIEELDGKKYLEKGARIIINGDSAGRNRDTRNVKSDYDIIFHELGKRGCIVENHVPASNPALRTRHNDVNAYCCNSNGKRRLFVYQKAKTADEGFRLTRLKKGATYIEDDSKAYQHITTAIGYGIIFEKLIGNRRKQGTVYT